MADFQGTVPTRLGLELLGLLGTGVVNLNFTRVAVGSGVWTPQQVAAPAEMTGLIKEEMTLAISPESVKPVNVPEGDAPAGCYAISVMLTNAGLENGFALREIGLFATHPQRGEILFAVDYAGDLSDYVPALPANAAPLEKQFKLNILTGTAKEIFVNQAPVLLATHEDITDHNADPEAHDELFKRLATGTTAIISPADGATDIGETPIFIFGEFIPTLAGTSEQAIQFQTDIIGGDFTSPIHDSGFLTTIASGYELPRNIYEPKQSYKSRVRRRLNNGLISEWSEIPTLTTRDIFNYVLRPTNIEPVSGATNVGECPVFKCSPFVVAGDVADTHVATQFRIRQGDTVIHLSPELAAVLEYKLPAGLHLVGNDYVYEFRLKGSLLGWGEWAVATPYRTAAAFITGDEAVYPSSWVGHDNASSAGVALADDAALRSNGIDQDTGESDWVEYSVRAKVRGINTSVYLGTTAAILRTLYKIFTGNKIATSEGIADAGDVTTETVSSLASSDPFGDGSGVALYPFDNNLIGSGPRASEVIPPNPVTYITGKHGKGIKTATAPALNVPVDNVLHATVAWWTCPAQNLHTGKYQLSWLQLGGLCGPDFGRNTVFIFGQQTSVDMSAWYNLTNWIHCCVVSDGSNGYFYINGDLVATVDSIDLSGSAALTELGYGSGLVADIETFDQVRVINRTANASEVGQLYAEEMLVYNTDISAAGFINAPSAAAIMPKLTAATGPAGTAFTADNFKEIAVESATLGTDSDPDRPDFILLESTKQTPAESFRRVALGVSGLSNDSEARVPETQINTWKQGA